MSIFRKRTEKWTGIFLTLAKLSFQMYGRMHRAEHLWHLNFCSKRWRSSPPHLHLVVPSRRLSFDHRLAHRGHEVGSVPATVWMLRALEGLQSRAQMVLTFAHSI